MEAIGVNTSTSAATQIQAAGSANSYGSYTELIASTAADSEWCALKLGVGSTDNTFVVALATGAAASETDIIEIMFWSNGTVAPKKEIFFPLSISSGSRVSARMKSTTASRTVEVAGLLMTESNYGTFNEASLIGEDATNSAKGTQVDPGGTANTKGSWVELTSSTPHDFDFLIIHIGGDDNNATSQADALVDIGTGAAASETVIIPNISAVQTTNEANANNFTAFVDVPSGTRIAARAQCSINTVSAREMDVSITGIRLTAPSGGGGSSETAHVFAC